MGLLTDCFICEKYGKNTVYATLVYIDSATSFFCSCSLLATSLGLALQFNYLKTQEITYVRACISSRSIRNFLACFRRCGAAIMAADFGTGGNGTSLGLGFIGVSLAFGLTVLTGAYAVGHVSGAHFNPAVTLGLVAGGRFPAAKAPGYIIAQVIGGTLGALAIYSKASGHPEFAIEPVAGTFATNGFGPEGSPGGYSMASAFVTEAILTGVFLVIIMGATAKRAAPAMAGLAIGLGLTLIHMVSIPVTNTSVNPARSTSQAIIALVKVLRCPCHNFGFSGQHLLLVQLSVL